MLARQMLVPRRDAFDMLSAHTRQLLDNIPAYSEQDGSYEATLCVPASMSPEEVKVAYHNGMLHVSGEKHTEQNGVSSYSSFAYSSTFPSEANHANAIVTDDGNGRFRLRVPK